MAKLGTSIFARIRQAFARMRESVTGSPTIDLWHQRLDDYKTWELLYGNKIYRRIADGGLRENIIKEVLGAAIHATLDESTGPIRIVGHFNPIAQIVDAYRNVLRGTWGKEITIAPLPDGKPANPALVDAIGRIWQWSNLDTEKQIMQRWAANLGTVGIRVVAINDPDPRRRRVSLQFDHPGRIVDFEQDDRGNVTAVALDYQIIYGSGKDARTVDVEEYIGKDVITRTYNGEKVYEMPNELGVCPYIILRHTDDGSPFGKPAHEGTPELLHQINWVITNQGESTFDHMWPTWFASASGDVPTSIQIGKKNVAYVKTQPGSTPPSMEALVPQIQHDQVTAFLEARKDEVRERQPEMVLNSIKALSGQSGETIAKLLTPVETKVLEARVQYEHALRRAIQIGLSWGVMLGLWDLGTGAGSKEAAENAFLDGLEDFEFAQRPALPQTVFDQQQQIELQTKHRAKNIADAQAGSGIISRMEQLRIYTDGDQKRADQIMSEIAGQDTIVTDGQGL